MGVGFGMEHPSSYLVWGLWLCPRTARILCSSVMFVCPSYIVLR